MEKHGLVKLKWNLSSKEMEFKQHRNSESFDLNIKFDAPISSLTIFSYPFDL